ncbi:hypothetical protein [Streptomyces sp. NPDC001948]
MNSAHVLVIGTDGVRLDLLRELHTPHLDGIARAGFLAPVEVELPPCPNSYMKCRTITFRSGSAQGVRPHRAAAVTAGARPPRIPHRIAFVEFHRRSLGRASSKEGRPVDEEWR